MLSHDLAGCAVNRYQHFAMLSIDGLLMRRQAIERSCQTDENMHAQIPTRTEFTSLAYSSTVLIIVETSSLAWRSCNSLALRSISARTFSVWQSCLLMSHAASALMFSANSAMESATSENLYKDEEVGRGKEGSYQSVVCIQGRWL